MPALARTMGDATQKPLGSDRLPAGSRRAVLILGAIERQPDITLADLRTMCNIKNRGWRKLLSRSTDQRRRSAFVYRHGIELYFKWSKSVRGPKGLDYWDWKDRRELLSKRHLPHIEATISNMRVVHRL